jgi:hypothetical protein
MSKLEKAETALDKATAIREGAINKLMHAQMAVIIADSTCDQCMETDERDKLMEVRDDAIFALFDADYAFSRALKKWGDLEHQRRNEKKLTVVK